MNDTPTAEQRVMAHLAQQRNHALDTLAHVAAQLEATEAALRATEARLAALDPTAQGGA